MEAACPEFGCAAEGVCAEYAPVAASLAEGVYCASSRIGTVPLRIGSTEATSEQYVIGAAVANNPTTIC